MALLGNRQLNGTRRPNRDVRKSGNRYQVVGVTTMVLMCLVAAGCSTSASTSADVDALNAGAAQSLGSGVLTPYLGSPTATLNGFTVQILNYHLPVPDQSAYRWSSTIVSGKGAHSQIDNTGLVTVSDLDVSRQAEVKVSLGTSNGKQLGESTATGQPIPTIEFGAESPNIGGFTVPITNYNIFQAPNFADYELVLSAQTDTAPTPFPTPTLNTDTGVVTVTGLTTVGSHATVVADLVSKATHQSIRHNSMTGVGSTTACASGGLCRVGDTGPGGGKVIYAATQQQPLPGSTKPGYTYVEAAPTALPGSYVWSCSYQFIDALGLGVFDGTWDTAWMIAPSNGANTGCVTAQQAASGVSNTFTAAQAANNYSNGPNIEGYSSWYLPSLGELTLLCRIVNNNHLTPYTTQSQLNQCQGHGEQNAAYWSASETPQAVWGDGSDVYLSNMLNFGGGQWEVNKTTPYQAWPVRAINPILGAS